MLLLLLQNLQAGAAVILPVQGAAFDIDGQDIGLNLTWSIPVEVGELEIIGQEIGFAFSVDQPEVTEQPSGGYGFGAFDSATYKRRKRERDEEQERVELADRLEAVMLGEGSLTKTDADLIRLRGQVESYEYLPNKARRAVLYAERARTEQALNLALREIQRLQDEEMAVLAIVLALD